MRAKVASLLAEIPSLAIVDHGFMFKTKKLRFFLQGSSPFIPEVTAQAVLVSTLPSTWRSRNIMTSVHPDLLRQARAPVESSLTTAVGTALPRPR
eukprot:89856-Hanusia_phi.AAC.1